MEYASLGWLVKERNTLPWQQHFRGTVAGNIKDAIQFRTVVLAVEIDEPTTKKIRENAAQFNFSNYSVVFNISNKHLLIFFFMES